MPDYFAGINMDQHVFTVTDLNNRIKLLLDSDPVLSGIYVKGELSNIQDISFGAPLFHA